MPTAKTVILCAGDFPRHPVPLAILEQAARVVCCDSAAENLLAWGRRPDRVVGDLDSLSPQLQATLQPCLVKIGEQETNDLAKAFRHCLVQGWDDLVILGATGRREDHTLGNISLLADFSLSCPQIEMVTDFGRFLPLNDSGTVACRPGQSVSIFSFNPQQEITSEGLLYPLKNLRLTRWWQATLNTALSNVFSLTLTGQGTVLVFLQH
jgi:thiamine pyrophosphokinase